MNLSQNSRLHSVDSVDADYSWQHWNSSCLHGWFLCQLEGIQIRRTSDYAKMLFFLQEIFSVI